MVRRPTLSLVTVCVTAVLGVVSYNGVGGRKVTSATECFIGKNHFNVASGYFQHGGGVIPKLYPHISRNDDDKNSNCHIIFVVKMYSFCSLVCTIPFLWLFYFSTSGGQTDRPYRRIRRHITLLEQGAQAHN